MIPSSYVLGQKNSEVIGIISLFSNPQYPQVYEQLKSMPGSLLLIKFLKALES